MNGLKPVGRDEVVPLTDEQKKELEKLVEEINATLAEEYGETEQKNHQRNRKVV